MAPGTPATARSETDGQVCSVGMLRGLYLWTLDGYQNVGGNLVPKAIMQGIRFNGDGTTFNTFGTVNIGGTIIIDAGGLVGTYTVDPDCTGTFSVPDIAPTLTCTSDRVHSRFGSPRGGRCGDPRTGCGNGDTAALAKARLLTISSV